MNNKEVGIFNFKFRNSSVCVHCWQMGLGTSGSVSKYSKLYMTGRLILSCSFSAQLFVSKTSPMQIYHILKCILYDNISSPHVVLICYPIPYPSLSSHFALFITPLAPWRTMIYEIACSMTSFITTWTLKPWPNYSHYYHHTGGLVLANVAVCLVRGSSFRWWWLIIMYPLCAHTLSYLDPNLPW